MPDELKEGDEVVLRGRVLEIEQFGMSPMRYVYLESETNNGKTKVCLGGTEVDALRKVRHDTYEVTAREIAKMICRACWTFWVGYMRSKKPSNGGKLEQPYFKKLQRWVHCRLRELRRKRGER